MLYRANWLVLSPAVSKDSNAERAAVNQTVRSPVVGAMAAEDLSPAAYAADTPNQTINGVDMVITKAMSGSVRHYRRGNRWPGARRHAGCDKPHRIASNAHADKRDRIRSGCAACVGFARIRNLQHHAFRHRWRPV